MKKQLLEELNRTREIMGLEILIEQENFGDVDKTDMEADMKKAGHKSTSEVGEFKEVDDGEPYALFVAKADTKSKAIFQSGEYTELDSKSLYYKYRSPNPFIEAIKNYTDQRDEWVQGFISTNFEGNQKYLEHSTKMWNEEYYPKLYKQLKKLRKQNKETIAKYQKATEEYHYSNKKGKRKEGWEKNPDYDPDGAKDDRDVTQAKKKVGDVNFSPTDRYTVMEKIGEYVQKEYGGDYGAAMSDKVWKKKGTKWWGSGWIKRGIKEITLQAKNIKTKTWTPEVEEMDNVGTQISYLNNDTDGQLFLNNLWKASQFFNDQLDLMVENIKINQQNVSERFDGVKVKMTVATEICSGGGEEVVNCDVKVPYPYTISSSCSRVPNGVNDKGEKLVGHGGTAPVEERIGFDTLSQNRANTAKQLIAEKLGAIGIEIPEPIIDWKGKNNDGTSGPDYVKGGAVESKEYKAARYVDIKIAIMYVAEVPIPEPPTPQVYKVGDFKVQLIQDMESWDPWWPQLPPFKWPRWKKFRWPQRTRKIKPWMTIKCPKFGRSSGPSNNSMGSDISLKENINLVGKSNSGINIYEFNYKDKKFGSGRYRGVMAQEVPQASLMSDEGYLMVDYSKIDVSFEEV